MLSTRATVLVFVGLAAAILAFAAWRLLPRYELRSASARVTYRLDRWTGDVAIVQQTSDGLVLRPVPVFRQAPARPSDQDILDALDRVQRER
jgi:hypothetical protein